MGYSGRYHAASLAAVFVALAVGILVGIGLADDVVSGASEELEDSLRSDRDEARDEVDSLTAELELDSAFADLAGAALVEGKLSRQGVGLFALGELPGDETADETEQALGAAGVPELASVSAIRLPPDIQALAEAGGGRFAAGRNAALPERLGAAIGRQLIGGGPLIERIEGELFSSFSGDLSGVNRAVLVSQPPEALQADLNGDGRAFQSAMLAAIDETADGTVGVERSTTDPTTLAVFSVAGIATVDDIDRASGQVSLVFALLGAEGDFGSKEAASSLLPDLVEPPILP